MNDSLRSYLDKFVIVFLDDILVYNKTLNDHRGHLQEVLQVLRDNQLYVKASKCEFDNSEVHYLDHRVTVAEI